MDVPRVNICTCIGVYFLFFLFFLFYFSAGPGLDLEGLTKVRVYFTLVKKGEG